MDKSVNGKPNGFGLSKVAKKRIAGFISVIFLIILAMGLSADQRILGTWEFNKPVRGDGEDILVYQFEENGLGRIYNKTSPEAAPHNIHNFGYAIDDSKLIIIEDGEEMVFDYSFTFNKLYFNNDEDNSLDYIGGFSPLLKVLVITILSLFVLWCFEEDFNVFLRAEGRWRKRLPNLRRRILAGVAFIICIVFALLAFLPSIRLPGTWNADIHYNTQESMPVENTTATYTFNDDNTGHYHNVYANGDVVDEDFKYDKKDVLSLVFPNDSSIPNEAHIVAEVPHRKVPGTYTNEEANIFRKEVKGKSGTYEITMESITYEFNEDGTGVLKVNKASANKIGFEDAPLVYDAETKGAGLTKDELEIFGDVKFQHTIEEDLILTFGEGEDARVEIYEYEFWFDTLFLDRVGDGDFNTYDCCYTIDTWFSPSFKLTVAGIALLIALYFMSVDFTEWKKAKEDKKKLKEALKAKKKLSEK